MHLYLLIVADGPYKGRYVGKNILGARMNPQLLDAPEIRVPGTDYSLFVQKDAASHFGERKASQVRQDLVVLGVRAIIEPMSLGSSRQ